MIARGKITPIEIFFTERLLSADRTINFPVQQQAGIRDIAHAC